MTESAITVDRIGSVSIYGSNLSPVSVGFMPSPSPCINGQNVLHKMDSMSVGGVFGVEMSSFMLNASDGRFPKSWTTSTVPRSIDVNQERAETNLEEAEYGKNERKINDSSSNAAMPVMDTMTIERINSASFDPEVIDEDEIKVVTRTPFD